MNASGVLSQALEIVAALALAPLLSGWVNQWRARLQNKGAPSLWQPYRLLHKLFHKESVVAEHASPLFRGAPYIVFGCMALACAIVPTLSTDLPLAPAADAIALVGLFALARVLVSLAAIDVGTAFGTLGARREMLIGFLAEPALLMVLFSTSLISQSTSLATMVETIAHRELELTVGAVLAHTVGGDRLTDPEQRDRFAAAMERMTDVSTQVYRDLVYGDPDFGTFFHQATPIDAIARLQLGSRPAKRMQSDRIEDLRAAAVFFTGRPFPMADARTLNVGSAAVVHSVLEISGATGEDLNEAYLSHGDLGDAASVLLSAADQPFRTPAQVMEVFERLAATSGAAGKQELLTELKTASETRAKEILDALRNESKEREEEERSLGKQIREQLKELREKRKNDE